MRTAGKCTGRVHRVLGLRWPQRQGSEGTGATVVVVAGAAVVDGAPGTVLGGTVVVVDGNAAIAPMIVVSCAVGAYAIQNAMFDIWLMLAFGVVGYVFKKIDIPLAPFTLALVLGNRAEDAFRLSMIGAGGDMGVFWSNSLVGSITTLALVLLFWPVISLVWRKLCRQPAALT